MEKYYLRFYQKLTIFGSLICIIFFGLSAFEETYLREWKIYQKEYKKILISTAQNEQELEIAENFSIEIRQIMLDDFDRVDRCISCHNGIENPKMRNQPPPHRPHSGNYLRDHPIESFGCSICHGGQDRALSRKEVFARTGDIHWEYPVVPVMYVQSSCGQCHVSVFDRAQTLEGAETLTKGRDLFLSEGCLSCHNVRGTGGAVGVDLTDQGKKTALEYSFEFVPGERSVINWLKEHFIDPQKVSPGSVMPKYDLSVDDMTALITFTMSLRYPRYPVDYYSVNMIEEIKGNRKRFEGREAYDILCSACHGENGESNDFREFERIVPSLNNREFLAAASRDMIKFTIKNGRSGMYMSAWSEDHGGLSDEEIEKIVDLIQSWKAEPPTFSEVMSSPGNRQFGETLFRSRCGTCHGADGQGGIGPSLNNQSFLSIATDNYLYETITQGRENTAMVSWSFLKKDEIAGIIAYLRSWQTVPSRQGLLTEQVRLGAASVVGDIETGQELFAGMCAGCHGRHGQGAVGPAILNKDFLRAASDQFILNSITRGRNQSAMRSFGKEFQGLEQLNPQELNDIVAFIRSRENVESDAIYTNITPGTPSIGRELFAGMCAGCHGTNGEGKHGPALNSQEFLNAATNGFLQATIALGRGGTAMRSWAKGAQGYEELTTDEINDIVSYIRTWQKEVIPKN
ncbi:c-type cytochrome [candidate division KSB1 bacterium]|nr:c-type cytochrome [candidate division KSB1 bacterium]